MPTGTHPFKNGKKHTWALQETEKLSGNNRKINRQISETIFVPGKIYLQLVVF